MGRVAPLRGTVGPCGAEHAAMTVDVCPTVQPSGRAPGADGPAPCRIPEPEADVSIRRHNHHRHGSPETVTDPVCGLQISKYGATARREVAGTLYHFCSARCTSAFDADPARYTAPTG